MPLLQATVCSCCHLSGGLSWGGSGFLSLDTVLLSILLSIFLSWAVNRDLNSDLTTLDFLPVHLRDSLLLELFGTKGDETETTTLAWLIAGLKLLDHEARNGAEGDLRRGWLVSCEELLKL